MRILYFCWQTTNKLPLLENKEKETKDLLLAKAKDLGIKLKTVVILKGLVLLAIDNLSNKPVQVIARELKGYASYSLRLNHPELTEHSQLWENGYYCE